jgi:hypothetical protein
MQRGALVPIVAPIDQTFRRVLLVSLESNNTLGVACRYRGFPLSASPAASTAHKALLQPSKLRRKTDIGGFDFFAISAMMTAQWLDKMIRALHQGREISMPGAVCFSFRIVHGIRNSNK